MQGMNKENEAAFEYVEEPSSYLHCSICSDIFDKPIRLPCGHSFCAACIAEWSKVQPICPLDRRPFARSAPHDDFIVKAIIDELKVPAQPLHLIRQVNCPFRRLGCGWRGPRSAAGGHTRECAHDPSAQPTWLLTESVKNFQKKMLEQSEEVEEDDIPLALRLISKNRSAAASMR